MQQKQQQTRTDTPASSGNPSDENFNFVKKHTEKPPTARNSNTADTSKESSDSCGPCGGKSDSSKL